MTKCFSFTESKDSCYRSKYSKMGLKSTTNDLKDGTIIHCWIPKIKKPEKSNLLLIHGLGANTMWQWGNLVHQLIPFFNIYIPDLVFYGDSFTTRSDRSESFQAESVMRVMEANSVKKLSLIGLSYGGFVGYSMAAQFKDVVERVVICCAGVCLEEKDLADGVFPVTDVEEAAKILVPQTAAKMKELVGYTFFRPPPIYLVPSCFLNDFVEVMCKEHVEGKKDLIRAIARGRKLSDIPKISQPTLIVWGEHDRVFPISLAHRLKRHLGENAELVVIKNAGHVFNLEKPKEFFKILKPFILDLQPTPNHK